MIRRSLFILTAAALTTLSLGSMAFAATGWDGAWGNGSPLVNIKGHTIAYSYQGRSYPVSGIHMSPKQLAFQAGAASVVMTPTPDGKAHFHFTLNGKTNDFTIWKQ